MRRSKLITRIPPKIRGSGAKIVAEDFDIDPTNRALAVMLGSRFTG
ncbi:hypothetical protein HNQ36_005298 [Afipia massiliensis]|uniref:Uncharacterized protein n=1 Tax=Afipia massiliensis TaxID=211460 RepID=A0A840N9K2_9BRAD|nr:hypothetical protein [Afipia massiliensis]MBB5055287.1 hypothetical protein [Afipia massiliensis]